MAKKTVGQFEIEDGTLTGPKQYLEEQGDAKVARMLSGNDAGFNAMCMARPDADVEAIFLVALQTDYAGWLGMQQFVAGLLNGGAK